MNLFDILFYNKYVNPVLYPIPVEHWVYFNEALATFPTIDTPFPNITQAPRRTKTIQIVILHHSGSFEFAKALKWFGNPNTYSSTNYLIDLDGYTTCLVPDERAALHTPNAKYNNSRFVNEMSLGVTLIGDGNTAFTEAQYEAVAMLFSTWKKKYNLNNESFWKHSDIECKPMANDPTPWDHAKFLKLVEQFDNI